MDLNAVLPSAWIEDRIDPTTGRPALSCPGLASAAVHLWATTTRAWLDESYLLRGLLTSEEQRRADAFVFACHRRQYVISHAFLRIVLSWYVMCPPWEIRFAAGYRGKPRLANADACPGLEFNLSHCSTLTVVGLGWDAIGVDVEEVRADVDDAKVAGYFHAHERAQLEALPPDCRRSAFYRGWTRKEAVAKAVGAGLSIGLDSFAVDLATDTPSAVKVRALETGVLRLWHLVHLEPLAGFVGALAVPFRPVTLHAVRLAGPLVPDGRRPEADSRAHDSVAPRPRSCAEPWEGES